VKKRRKREKREATQTCTRIELAANQFWQGNTIRMRITYPRSALQEKPFVLKPVPAVDALLLTGFIAAIARYEAMIPEPAVVELSVGCLFPFL
jgi:hypothetical protein